MLKTRWIFCCFVLPNQHGDITKWQNILLKLSFIELIYTRIIGGKINQLDKQKWPRTIVFSDKLFRVALDLFWISTESFDHMNARRQLSDFIQIRRLYLPDEWPGSNYINLHSKAYDLSFYLNPNTNHCRNPNSTIIPTATLNPIVG